MNEKRVLLQDLFLTHYQDASIHVLVAEGVSNVNDTAVMQWRQKAATAVASWNIDPQRLVEEEWIADWRKTMKKMGVNPAKTRSSIEQLAKRALAGSFITTPIAAVNLYCAVSTIARAPMGGYRTESLCGDIEIKLATGSEMFLGIGEKLPMAVAPGVVIYADQEKVACYAWNHKDSRPTCLTPTTDHAIFFADAVSIEGRERAADAVRLLSGALESCGCDVTFTGVLDSQTRSLSLPLHNDLANGDYYIEVTR